ncbi:hypothetical protein O181_034841 [Austropuccinia psidii MF-1]|uniref:Uncharacterized protein n=1 Tax=Austropuccinia psidii MF-1 TaxID=1389203 RepID=A0A9Q3D772_9BASI|nr:hypothetical protein [Austropuccinia psidii MF-1]
MFQSGVAFTPYQYAQHIQKKQSFLNSQLSISPQTNQAIPVQSTSTIINLYDLLTEESLEAIPMESKGFTSNPCNGHLSKVAYQLENMPQSFTHSQSSFKASDED